MQRITYDPLSNANRLGLTYADSKGNGAIEVFVNSRKVTKTSTNYYSLVHQRQSSVRRRVDMIDEKGGLQQAASQLLCDYAVEYNLTFDANNSDRILGTFRVFSYLQPQDAYFFQSPDLPVAMFQYQISLTKTNS